MNGHVPYRQRLLMLLAGFFGFVITTTISVFPGVAVAEVIRTGAATPANAVAVGTARTDRPVTRTADGARPGHDATAQSDRHDVAVLPDEPPADASDRPARAAAGLSTALPSAPVPAVRVRGPPSSTGS